MISILIFFDSLKFLKFYISLNLQLKSYTVTGIYTKCANEFNVNRRYHLRFVFFDRKLLDGSFFTVSSCSMASINPQGPVSRRRSLYREFWECSDSKMKPLWLTRRANLSARVTRGRFLEPKEVVTISSEC